MNRDFQTQYSFEQKTHFSVVITHGIVCWQTIRLVIERLRVRILTEAAGEFSFTELALCPDSYSVSVLPPVTAVARKRPRSFCQSAGGRLHLTIYAPLTKRSRSGLTMPLSRHSLGTYKEKSSHATRQGTLSQRHLSSVSHCELILAKTVD